MMFILALLAMGAALLGVSSQTCQSTDNLDKVILTFVPDTDGLPTLSVGFPSGQSRYLLVSTASFTTIPSSFASSYPGDFKCHESLISEERGQAKYLCFTTLSFEGVHIASVVQIAPYNNNFLVTYGCIGTNVLWSAKMDLLTSTGHITGSVVNQNVTTTDFHTRVKRVMTLSGIAEVDLCSYDQLPYDIAGPLKSVQARGTVFKL